MRKSTRLLALLTACACWLSTLAFAQAAPVTVRLEPDTIAAGQAATLAITTDGTSQPEVPAIAGLSIQPIGTQTSVSVTNGVRAQSVTQLYSVQAQRPGDYDLVGIRAGTARAPKLSLHVQAAASAPPTAAESASPTEAAKLAFARLHVDEQRIYTGQSVPFTLKAFFRGGTGVTLRSRPELSSDAFTVSGLDQEPTQQESVIDGVPYLAVTWRGVITAAKAGDFALDMTLPVSMQYRDQAQPVQRPRGRSLRDLFGSNSPFGAGSVFDRLFDDSLFDSMFDEPLLQGFGQLGRTVQRDLDLHARAGTAHVAALPSAGRPAAFSGAVGQFDVAAQLAQRTLTQGEPVDLQLHVRGTGNFGQFSLPSLTGNADWKAYAGHSNFAASDKAGLRGEQSMQQPVAALHEGHLSLPALDFSYFDPKQARYVTKTTAPIVVDVTPAPAQASTDTQAPQPTAAAASSGSHTAEPSVRSLASGGVPEWLLPSALALLGLSVIACAAIAVRRSQRYQQRMQRLRARRAFSRQLRAMQQAERAGDRRRYLRAGRRALQRRLGASWGLPPESISVRELDARWPNAPEGIRQLLELADEADYGRASPATSGPEFAVWARTVDQQLSHMEIPS